MHTSQREVEAYVKEGSFHTVVALLSKVIGPLKTDDPSDSDLQVYELEGVTAVLQKSEDGFISVWVRENKLWSSSAALGRYLAAELGCVVRCDPENEFPEVSPHSNVFLQIEGNCESLVAWG